MVKLKRVVEDEGISGMPDLSTFPQTPIMYYGLKQETALQEYQFYFAVYDKNLSIKEILSSTKRPDRVFKSTSRHSLESDMQNSGFLSDKDFGAINKYRNTDTRTFIGYILDPTYSIDRDKWDYARVYLDVKNNIKLVWRH